MTAKNYPFIRIACPRKYEEMVIDLLIAKGFTHFAYVQQQTYNVLAGTGEMSELECYMEDAVLLRQVVPAIKPLLARFNVRGDYTIQQKERKDWSEDFARNYPDIDFYEGIRVIPPWRRERTAKEQLIIDPGQAFGTGRHFTTRSCAFLITQSQLLFDDFLFDLGCGSAILSIFICKLGASSVVAVDRDRETMRNSRRNTENNKAHQQILLLKADVTALPFLPERLHKTVMNMEYDVITACLTAWSSSMNIGDWLILGGILLRERAMMKQLLRAKGFGVLTELTDGEWVSFRVQKK